MIGHLAFLTLLISSSSFAQHGHALTAHEHGAVKMAMALEGQNIDIDLEGPSESFLGFEHKAKSKSDLQFLQRAKNLWNTELLTKLVIFDIKLGCKINSASFEQTQPEGEHSEIQASAQISCVAEPKGSELKIGIRDQFPKVKKLKLEIIGNNTKVLDIKKTIEYVKL